MRSFLTVSFISFFSWTVEAATYDPDLTWRVLETEHFDIHFHGGEEQLAEEMGHLVEEVYAEMTAELDWVPKGSTQVVLLDNTDSANGYATYLPRNTIVIFVTAPEGTSTLSWYEDWNDAIFTHEYTHILHLDTIEGLPAVARAIFGRVAMMNGLSPNWIIEGQATMQETWQSNMGRGRAPIPDMIKRTATIEDQFPPLGNMDGFQTTNPGGNLRYLFGQDFMNYIAEETHNQVWTEWNHTYGGGIPYWLPAKKVLGKRFPEFYTEWKSSMEERYANQISEIEAIGITEYTLLSDEGRNCAFAHYAPDGSKMVYSCFSLENGSSVYIADPDGNEEHVEIAGVFGRNFGWRADGQAFAYSAMRTVNRFNLYSDVYLHNVSGSTTTLTRGKRARDPEFSLDGSSLLVVTNETQNNQLKRLRIDQRMSQLTEHTDHTQYSTPKYSPDGKWIATSMWHQGQRDLWILDADANPIRQLTNDWALDTEPRWSPDGRTLYFSSDRTGIYNIFAIDLETETLYQVTNVRTGAFTPSINHAEDTLLFTVYHHWGYGIAQMPIDRNQWIEVQNITPESEDALHTSHLIPESLKELPKGDAWTAPDEELDWWQWRAKVNERRKGNLSVPAHPSLTAHYPGLSGVGGPLFGLTEQDPTLPMPHRPAYFGEFDNANLFEGPNSGPDIQDDTQVDEENKEESDYPFTFPVRRYEVKDTLFPPTFLAPSVFQTGFGYMGVLSTSSVDTLKRQLYAANVSYRTDSQFFGWGASYLYNKWIPVLSTGIYSTTVPYGNIYTYNGAPEDGGTWIPNLENTGLRYWDKRLNGYAQVTYAHTLRHSFFGRYEYSYRTPWVSSGDGYSNQGLPNGAYRPYLPTRGVIAGFGGGWRYVRARAYARAISPEDTRLISVVGRVQAPWLGAYTLDDTDQPISFTRVQLTAEWREYTGLPWGDNHVLATKMAVGFSSGDAQRYGSFRLGGSFGESGYYTLPDEWRALRGFDPASVSGDGYYLGAIEYRMPLWWIDWGYNVTPLFLRSLSGAVFTDFGMAYDAIDQLSQAPLMGMGAELRMSTIVSWGAPLSFRGGYAFGLNGGVPIGSIEGFYAWLGSSF